MRFIVDHDVGKNLFGDPSGVLTERSIHSNELSRNPNCTLRREHKRSYRCQHFLLVVCCFLFLPLTQFAAPTVYEPFNYSNGSNLAGGNGGIGFADAWTTSGAVDGVVYSPGDLSYGLLDTSGGKLFATIIKTVQVDRPLVSSLGGDGTTTFVSLLFRPEYNSNARFAELGLMGSKGNCYLGKNSNANGMDGTHYMVNVNGSQGSSSIGAAADTAVLLVLRADFGNGASTFKLFVNPALGSEPNLADATVSGDIGTVSAIEFSSTLGASIDEIRIGGTYADVASAVPEETTIGAAIAVAFIVVASNLKRRLEDLAA